MNICQEDNGNAKLHNKVIEGNVPQLCVDEAPTPVSVCPPSVIPPLLYPCVSNCEPGVIAEITNIASENSMLDRISPNPTSNYLDVSLKDVCTNITTEVVDLDGKLLFKLDFENAKDFRINFPFVLPNGTYSLLLNADGKRSTTNFVITK
jgi:hypothetical protein